MTTTTTTMARFAFVLLALSTPALAEPVAPVAPVRPVSMKIRFTVRDAGAMRNFQLAVSPDAPCAAATSRVADQIIELKACASRELRLNVEWFVHSAAGEYSSTSSIPMDHGATTELGSAEGPRLTVVIP